MSNIYLVICGTREPYVPERDISEMGREETIKSLAAGEWGDINGDRFTVSSIIEVGTDADKTAEFIEAAKLLMDSYRSPISGEELAAVNADRRRAMQAAE